MTYIIGKIDLVKNFHKIDNEYNKQLNLLKLRKDLIKSVFMYELSDENRAKNLKKLGNASISVLLYRKYYEKIINELDNDELIKKLIKNAEMVREMCDTNKTELGVCRKINIQFFNQYFINNDIVLNNIHFKNFLGYIEFTNGLKKLQDNCGTLKNKKNTIIAPLNNFSVCVNRYFDKLFNFYLTEGKFKLCVSLISLIQLFSLLTRINGHCLFNLKDEEKTKIIKEKILTYLGRFIKTFKQLQNKETSETKTDNLLASNISCIKLINSDVKEVIDNITIKLEEIFNEQIKSIKKYHREELEKLEKIRINAEQRKINTNSQVNKPNINSNSSANSSTGNRNTTNVNKERSTNINKSSK